jgi:hypothetical protein
MDARRLANLIRSQESLLDYAVLRAAADRLEQQQTEIISQERRILDLGRELLVAEACRLQLEARNRELLARCDLLSCELLLVGRKLSMRRFRSCVHGRS